MQYLRLHSLLAGLAVLVAVPGLAQVRTFDRPQYQDMNVSYCGTDAASCGERMATTWCRVNGYEYASDWAAGNGIDATSRTVRLDDGAICQGAQCESFAQITCGREEPAFTTLVAGPAERSTILAPNRRTTAASLNQAEFQVLIPGCSQREPGVFICESVLEYQHCRSLMLSRMIYSCRAALSFDSEFAEPRSASADQYSLEVQSNASVRVERGSRGFGQIKGDAEVELVIEPPLENEAWCLQRDSYLFYPTGPMGGMSDIGDSADCSEPIEFSFEPHEDDLLRAYDLCESFAAWGSTMEDSIDMLAAGLFQIRSASPAFAARSTDGKAVIAPFVRIEAALEIDCRD